MADHASAKADAARASDAVPVLIPDAHPPIDAKTVSTLRARAALRGFVLIRLPDGFSISRWDMSRPLDSVAAVERFLEAVGA